LFEKRIIGKAEEIVGAGSAWEAAADFLAADVAINEASPT
jgi:hypothetical protein